MLVMESSDVLLTILTAIVGAGVASIHLRLGRVEHHLTDMEVSLAKKPDREDLTAIWEELRKKPDREELTAVSEDLHKKPDREELYSIRADLTQIALAVGARSPRASEG